MLFLKCVTREYYRQNFAFYALIVFLAFGFMSGREHMQLVSVIMGRPGLLVFVSFVWLIHVGKSGFFVHQQLKLPEYQLFQDFALKKRGAVLLELLLLQITLNAPFLAYAFFMGGLGWQNGDHKAVFWVLIINFLFILVPATGMLYRLRKFNINDSLAISRLSVNRLKGARFYFFRHLLTNKLLLYVSTKFYGIFLLAGSAGLFPTDDYDYRLLAIAIFLTGLGQMTTGREFQNFIGHKMSFERNMPLLLRNRLLSLCILSFVLMLPEFLILIYHWVNLLPLVYVAESVIYLLVIQLLWLVVQFYPPKYLEENQNRLFLLSMAHFILIMFNVPITVFSLGIGIASWFIFSRNYYTFEPSVSDSE